MIIFLFFFGPATLSQAPIDASSKVLAPPVHFFASTITEEPGVEAWRVM
jgi:hypothetical protein